MVSLHHTPTGVRCGWLDLVFLCARHFSLLWYQLRLSFRQAYAGEDVCYCLSPADLSLAKSAFAHTVSIAYVPKTLCLRLVSVLKSTYLDFFEAFSGCIKHPCRVTAIYQSLPPGHMLPVWTSRWSSHQVLLHHLAEWQVWVSASTYCCDFMKDVYSTPARPEALLLAHMPVWRRGG